LQETPFYRKGNVVRRFPLIYSFQVVLLKRSVQFKWRSSIVSGSVTCQRDFRNCL